MKRAQKGSYGYIRAEQKRRGLITVIAFAIPVLIFLTGYAYTHTRNNLFTFVAIMGCLPASKCAVGMIMILLQKPISQELYAQVEEHAKGLTVIYEATVSSYEKNIPLPCIVVCGTHVVCYTPKLNVDTGFAEKHIQDMLKGNGYRCSVKVLTDRKQFLRRVDELSSHRQEWENAPFRPDERYPDATLSELVKQLILCICI